VKKTSSEGGRFFSLDSATNFGENVLQKLPEAQSRVVVYLI